jgi:hypothetical protein
VYSGRGEGLFGDSGQVVHSSREARRRWWRLEAL